MSDPPSSAAAWRFGIFVLQPGHALRRGNRTVALGRRALDLLDALVQAGGDVVGKAALMRAAWPGQVVVENALHQHMRALRSALGDQAALVETVPGRGYRLAVAVERCDGEAAVPPALPPRPTPAWPLIGRQALLQQLATALAARSCTTLLGPSGIGKTRLALELAQACEAHGRTVVWCDLGLLDRGAEVPDAVARAFGLPGQGGSEAIRRTALALRDGATLLVLDNCEHVHDEGAAAAQSLLDRCPGLAVLATSQRPLGLAAEQRCPVGPLPLPPPGADDAAVLRAAPAVQLLLDRVRLAGGPDASDAELPLAVALCRRLDGVPLALELAAARVAALGWAATLDGLSRHFGLLVGGVRRTRPRHRSLDAAIAWSCDLLPPALQRAWQALSVFRGGWTLAGAQAVLGPAVGAGALDIAAVLAELDERSLIQRDASLAAPRFRMLEAQRCHAHARLLRSKAVAEVLRRHALHVAELAERADDEWDRCPDADWLAQHGAEFDNLVAAVHAAQARGEQPLAVRLVGAGLAFWRALGALPTLRTLLEHPLLAVVEPCDRDSARLLLARAVSLLGEASDNALFAAEARRAVDAADTWLPPLARAQARLCLASAAARQGHVEVQAAALSAADALLQQAPAGKTWAWCRSASGWALQLRGELPAALAAVQQARAAWGDRGAWLDEGRALIHVADLQLALGNVEAAIDSGAQAVARFEGSLHRELHGRALANLGAAWLRAGRQDRGVVLLSQGLQQLQGLDFSYWVFDHFAALAVARGELLAAARWLGHADAGYARHRGGRRLSNEARAHAEAMAVLRTRLDTDELRAALQAGAMASEAQLLREVLTLPAA